MKRFVTSSIAVVSAMAMLTAPVPVLAAQSKLMPQASESMTPTAKGPKPYQASRNGACESGACSVVFPKKSGKVRHITDVSCLLLSTTGVANGALIRVGERQISYLPFNSRGASGGTEYATGALAIAFDVAGGEVLSIELGSSGTAVATNCVIIGTIE